MGSGIPDAVPLTPAQAAAEAAALASAWIAASPPLTDVLAWHQRLCAVCEPAKAKCAEYHEIIAEYGAGSYGASVFYPAGGS